MRIQYATRALILSGNEDDRVVTEVHRTVRDDPLSSLVRGNGAIGLMTIGRLVEATELAEQALELDRESLIGNVITAWTAMISGDFSRGLPAAESALRITGRHPWVLAILTSIHASLGDTVRAQAIHDELRARDLSGSVSSMWLSFSALGLGRVDEAMDHAMRSIEQRELYGPWVKRFPGIEPLQAHPRYPQLLRMAGFVNERPGSASSAHG